MDGWRSGTSHELPLVTPCACAAAQSSNDNVEFVAAYSKPFWSRVASMCCCHTLIVCASCLLNTMRVSVRAVFRRASQET